MKSRLDDIKRIAWRGYIIVEKGKGGVEKKASNDVDDDDDR